MKNNKYEFETLNGPWSSIKKFKVEKLCDDYSGLSVEIKEVDGNGKVGRLRFSSYYGYRNFNEADLWRRWSEMEKNLLSGVYVSKNSKFLDWASDQSPYQEISKELSHYLIISIEDVIDIIAFDDPSFETDK